MNYWPLNITLWSLMWPPILLWGLNSWSTLLVVPWQFEIHMACIFALISCSDSSCMVQMHFRHRFNRHDLFGFHIVSNCNLIENQWNSWVRIRSWKCLQANALYYFYGYRRESFGAQRIRYEHRPCSEFKTIAHRKWPSVDRLSCVDASYAIWCMLSTNAGFRFRNNANIETISGWLLDLVKANNQYLRSVHVTPGILHRTTHFASRFCEIWDAIYYIMFVHRFHLDSMVLFFFSAFVRYESQVAYWLHWLKKGNEILK